ncbi:MAG: hypothetical protein U1E50_04105 [Caulobacteraceae bacterium]
MTLPDIIFLNGASCAGKTSITRGLQDLLPAPYMRLGVDDVVFPLAPPRWLQTEEGVRGIYREDGGVEIRLGPGGWALQRAFHRCARAIVDSGVKLVMDEVLFDPALLTDWREVLAGLDVMFVGVLCDLEELEARERIRPDRANGQCRAQVDIVHGHGAYDLTVDTTVTPASACVRQIIEGLAARRGSFWGAASS